MTRVTWFVAGAVLALSLLLRSYATPFPSIGMPNDSGDRIAWDRYREVLLAAAEAHTLLDVARWEARGSGDARQVSVDPGVAPPSAALAREAIERQLDSLGLTGSPRLRVRVVPVKGDSVDAASPATRAPFTVTWRIPRDPSAPCLVLVQLRDAIDGTTSLLRTGAVAGPCRFHAAFGPPGPAIRAWLDTARHSFATRAVPGASREELPPLQLSPIGGSTRTDRWDRSMLPLGAASCLLGHEATCRVLLGVARDSTVARVPGDPYTLDAGTSVDVVTGRLASSYGRRFGAPEGHLLADLLADVGPERFAAFWTSPQPVEAAFAQAIGQPFATWTRAWLARSYDDRPPGPRVPATSMALAVGATLVALGVAIASAVRRGA